MLVDEQIRSAMIDFAEKHFGEYKIETKAGGDEIIPKFCPFCHGGSNNHDTRTFALSLEKAVYVCKRGSCGRRGRFDQLVRELTGEEIKLFSGKPSSHKSSSPSGFVLPTTELYPVTQRIYDYFQLRGIDKNTVDYFRIAADKDGNIVFRFFEDGVDVFHKFRRDHKPTEEELRHLGKEWREKNTKAILFNLDGIDLNEPVLLTEGQCDCMALWQAGAKNVVSVPSGSSDDSWLEHCWATLEKVKTFILFGDNDPPGREMIQRIAKRLGEYRCKIVVDYPPVPNHPDKFCKDANEVLVRCGEFELIDMIENAVEPQIKGLINIGDVKPVDPTTIPRIPTCIPALNESMGGLVECGITVVTGESAAGKSVFVEELVLNAVEKGYKTCIYSGELSREKLLEIFSLQAAGSDWIGLKYDRGRGKKVPFVAPNVAARIQEYLTDKVYIFNNTEVYGKPIHEAIMDMFDLAVRRYGCRLLVVDNLMSCLCEEDEELKAQTKFIATLKSFAVKTRTHVIVVAHPRKEKAGIPLTKSSVAGSANIVNLADNAVAISRSDITILKNRDSGEMKTIATCYTGDSRHIYQADSGDKLYCSWDRKGLTPLSPADRADSLPEYGVIVSDLPTASSPF